MNIVEYLSNLFCCGYFAKKNELNKIYPEAEWSTLNPRIDTKSFKKKKSISFKRSFWERICDHFDYEMENHKVKKFVHIKIYKLLVFLKLKKPNPRFTLKSVVILSKSAQAFKRSQRKKRLTFRKLVRLSRVINIIRPKRDNFYAKFKKFAVLIGLAKRASTQMSQSLTNLREAQKELIDSRYMQSTETEERNVAITKAKNKKVSFKTVSFLLVTVEGLKGKVEKSLLAEKNEMANLGLGRKITLKALSSTLLVSNFLLRGMRRRPDKFLDNEGQYAKRENANAIDQSESWESNNNGTQNSETTANNRLKSFERQDTQLFSKTKGLSRFKKLAKLSEALIYWQICSQSKTGRKRIKYMRDIKTIEGILERTIYIRNKSQKELDDIMPLAKDAYEKTEVPYCSIDLMKSQRFNPPRPVQLVMAAIVLLKGIQPEVKINAGNKDVECIDYWAPAQKLLAGNFYEELNSLRNPTSLLTSNIEEYQARIVNNPDFDRVAIERAFPPCAIIYDFILNIEHFGMILQPVKEKQDIIFVANLLIKKAEGTLKYLRKKLRRLDKKSGMTQRKSENPITVAVY